MVVDTSAVLAVLFQEAEADSLAAVMVDAPRLLMSACSRLEATLVAEGKRFGASAESVSALLIALEIQVVPFGNDHLVWALRGWREYGRGRHPAGLNLGDCFSYALARATGEPLLFIGNDFSLTDVAIARH
jgi:ribonuclease VapC